MRKRVLLTGNVLYPYALRDVLIRLGDVGLITPHWTPAIFAEMRSTIRTWQPRIRAHELERSQQLMRDMFPEADVLDYEAELDQIPAHVADRDVLAAGLAAGVDAIVTTDRRRFAPELYGYAGIAVITPDILLCQCLAEDPELVLQLLDEEGVQKHITRAEVVLALYPQAPQFTEAVFMIMFPYATREQFETIVDLERLRRLHPESNEGA
jgi:hypothetical protein